MRPKVLIAGEPVSAPDVAIQGQILDLLVSLQRDEKLTLLFISHDMAVVEKVADLVMVMYRGRIVEQGPATAVPGGPAHAYTRRLLQAVPVSHPARRVERLNDPVAVTSPVYPIGRPNLSRQMISLGQDHMVQAAED